MKQKRRTKRALINSVISLIICFSMLLGTTFAWFTDSVTSGYNVIQAGNLDIEMEYLDANKEWQPVTEATKLFDENALWEPGYTEVAYLRISNKGNLALKYQLGMTVASETGSINMAGEAFALSDYIEFEAIKDVTTPYADRTVAREAVTNSVKLSASYVREDALAAEADPHYVALVAFMPETVKNEANHATGVAAPKIQLGISLFATQQMAESDSFGTDYDENSAFPMANVNVSAASPVSNKVENGAVVKPISVGSAGSGVTAEIPAGVTLADGVTEVTLSVKSIENSEANIEINEGEVKTSVDVHIDGVAEDNTVPMLVTLENYLKDGLNSTSVALYHVEDGQTNPMSQVLAPEVPDEHNEFSYDPATGTVVMALKSFSEVAVVADINNAWDGETVIPYAVDSEDENTYLISSAEQLAAFCDAVDDGNSFAGKTVKLTSDINLGGQLFDPIGWGYENSAHNRKDTDGNNMPGKPFKGTFDGNYKTIYGLYQNGWDLESETDTVYTYTNCGFGLFASVSGGTIKNLTIDGADIRVECVEAGVLVGLSQGNCTYENINIYASKIANYQRPAGGLIGEVSGEGTTTITDVTIGSDVVVGSLWGDFDAPCGGVIGARWDDINADPKIVMTNVEVGCRMDVYSDVTSAYQWYAYRRAGMLVGNTEVTDSQNEHLAAAPFLTCNNVKVYYGDWAAYHYCQFINQDNEWCNNYPWVRVEEGENCSAYSNPRYGQPVIKGVTVSDDNHTCTGDNHHIELRFNQLYGGGQGVYGQPAHEGVEVVNYRYSITYVNDYQVLAIKYVTETGAVSTANGAAQDLVEKWANVNIGEKKWVFGGWMNAGSTKVETIPAGNTNNIVLYPYFNKPYTARFVDQQGNVIAWCFFHAEDTSKLEPTRAIAEAALPDLGEQLKFDYWEVQITNNEGNVTSKVEYNKSAFAGYEQDVTIYPVYKYEGDVKLIPVDTDSDGIINYYQVAGYSNPNGQALVKIPDSVNGIPVTEINKDAFSGYDGVHSIVIPEDVTYIGDNAFAKKWETWDNGESITIYYAGSYADWVKIEPSFGSNWESGISESSRIFFLNGGNTVDVSQGYLQAKLNGYTQNNKNISWTPASISSSIIVEYTGYCDCSISTTGDTAHTYVDASGNVMKHNDDGTPINSNGIVIEYKRKNIFSNYKLTTDDDDTYYRYRPDKAYWEGVTAE